MRSCTSSSLTFPVCSFARPSGAACFLFLFMVVLAFVNLNMTLRGLYLRASCVSQTIVLR
ncbi:hypothetical protein OROGR_018019 [Orobanche gracilis]